MNSETFVYLRGLFVFRRAYGVYFYFEKKAVYILYEEAFLWQPWQNFRCPCSLLCIQKYNTATLWSNLHIVYMMK